MKKIFILTSILFFCCKVLFAASITEELSQLNNLYSEGAITEEEFSKAKSILLKTNSSNEQSKIKKVNKKEKSKKLNQKTKTNEDLTKSYIHINELKELGSFVSIKNAPEGMFKTKSKHFSPKVKEGQENMYMVFVQKKGLMEKYPENLMKAMGYFEFFYMDQLRKKKKSLETFKEKWPDISLGVKKDMKSLYSLNKARKSMRESMGLTLNDDVHVALKRYMLMHNFLSKAKKETIKLNSEQKHLRKYSKKLNLSLSNIKKFTELKKEKRIKEKEFNKNFQICVKKSY